MKNYLKLLFIAFLIFPVKSFCTSRIPFELIDGKIVIKVIIDEKKYNFIFDSGALTMISDKLQNVISAKKTKILFDSKDANGQHNTKDLYQLKQLRLEDLNIEKINFSYVGLDWMSQRACMPIDGILGANAMDTKIWLIDFSKRHIEIFDKMPNMNDEGHFIIPFKKEPFTSVPIIEGNIRDKHIDFIFDTGSNGSISVQNSVYNDIKDDKYILSEGLISQSVNSSYIGKKEMDIMPFSTYKLNLGNKIIDSDGGTGNIIGTRFMENYIVIINFINNEIYLLLRNNTLNFNTFGIGLYEFNGKLVVINKYFIPETSQLEIKDIIIKVDNIDTRQVNVEKMCEILEKLRSSDKIVIQKISGESIILNKIDILNYLQ